MNINDILNRFRTDPEFAAKYTNLNGIEAVQSQLKADGYDVSLDDIRAGIGQLQGASGELSEAELAGVAGGSGVGKESWNSCPQCGSKNIKYEEFIAPIGKGPWGTHKEKITCFDCGYTKTRDGSSE